MRTNPIDVSILDCSDNASETYSKIYHYRKAFHRKFTLRYLCKASNIPSSGYLSDVFKGKRTLHKKHIKGLNSALELDSNLSEYMYLTVLLEKEKNDSKKQELYKAREVLRKRISFESRIVPENLEKDLLFHVIVMSSFALFQGKPTRKQLFDHFGIDLSHSLATSLSSLIDKGFIVEKDGALRLQKTHLFFGGAKDGYSHLNFVKQGFSDAIESLSKWYPRTEESAIYSSVITVNKDEFKAKIPEIKSKAKDLQNELDSENANQLVRFNFAVYPIE